MEVSYTKEEIFNINIENFSNYCVAPSKGINISDLAKYLNKYSSLSENEKIDLCCDFLKYMKDNSYNRDYHFYYINCFIKGYLNKNIEDVLDIEYFYTMHRTLYFYFILLFQVYGNTNTNKYENIIKKSLENLIKSNDNIDDIVDFAKNNFYTFRLNLVLLELILLTDLNKIKYKNIYDLLTIKNDVYSSMIFTKLLTKIVMEDRQDLLNDMKKSDIVKFNISNKILYLLNINIKNTDYWEKLDDLPISVLKNMYDYFDLDCIIYTKKEYEVYYNIDILKKLNVKVLNALILYMANKNIHMTLASKIINSGIEIYPEVYKDKKVKDLFFVELLNNPTVPDTMWKRTTNKIFIKNILKIKHDLPEDYVLKYIDLLSPLAKMHYSKMYNSVYVYFKIN